MVGSDKRFRGAGILILGALILVSSAACSSNKDLLLQKDEEIAALQSKVSTLESELADERAEAQKVHAELEGKLKSFQDKNDLLIDSLNNMTLITVDDAALFAFSSTSLTDNGTAILDGIAAVIKQHPGRQVWIEGHTDDVPIAMEFRDKFASNWEFSSARAHSALHYLLRKHDLNPQNVAAVGYGEYRPVADNSTEIGRAKNRRVVIVIGPQYMKSKTVSAPGAS